MKHALLAVALTIAPFAGQIVAETPALTIDGSVTIVESAQEPVPVHRATEDLRSDLLHNQRHNSDDLIDEIHRPARRDRLDELV